jgi:hypothetical protein
VHPLQAAQALRNEDDAAAPGAKRKQPDQGKLDEAVEREKAKQLKAKEDAKEKASSVIPRLVAGLGTHAGGLLVWTAGACNYMAGPDDPARFFRRPSGSSCRRTAACMCRGCRPTRRRRRWCGCSPSAASSSWTTRPSPA